MPSGQFRKPPTKPDHKWCTLCNVEKPYSEFGNNRTTSDGKGSHCKPCRVSYNNTPERKARRDELNAAYVLSEEQKAERERRAEVKARRKELRNVERQKSYDASPDRKAKRAQYARSEAGKASRRRYDNKKYHSNVAHRLKVITSVQVRIALSGNKGWVSTFATLGYSPEQMKTHLESLFVDGMTWENYGRAWQIDHIIPVASFDQSNPDFIKECWKLDNLRPLWVHLNREKSDRLDYELPDNWREIPEYAK